MALLCGGFFLVNGAVVRVPAQGNLNQVFLSLGKLRRTFPKRAA